MFPTLEEMKWEVPNYDRILATAFVTSLLTGGVGGVIYGSTKVDVYGDTTLKIKIIEQDTGKILIDKDYKAHIKERKAKLSCDTSTTKSEICGKSLKAAMELFKIDLAKIITNEPMKQAEADNNVDEVLPVPESAVVN